MSNNKTNEKQDENQAPILGSWKRIYLWLLILNFIFVLLSYLFMLYYT